MTAPASPPAVPLAKRLKFQLVRAIRGAGLLGAADACRFQVRRWKTDALNRRFLAGRPGFRPPPADLAFDAYNHFDWERYWEGGRFHAEFFAEAIRSALPEGPLRVLEWGCGPGRIIRHLPGLLADRGAALTGTDYNPRTIAWCREALPGISFAQNALMPPLPFADGSFDAVYNFSVFTHLSREVQLAWADELWRVLRPGGVMLCTTQGSGYRHMLASEEERARYDAGELIVQGKYREGAKWFFAVHPPRFVHEQLLRRFEEVEALAFPPEPGVRGDLLLQDVWRARKPAPG